MATPKELVATVAAQTGVPLATVAVHDRNLAEAGLRKKGQRGRGISVVSYEDAANLLIAVSASRNVKDSEASVRAYSVLKSPHSLKFCIDNVEVIRGRDFRDALQAFLELIPRERSVFSNGSNWVEVSFYGPEPKAKIEWKLNGEVFFREYNGDFKSSNIADLSFVSRFSQITLGFVGEILL